MSSEKTAWCHDENITCIFIEPPPMENILTFIQFADWLVSNLGSLWQLSVGEEVSSNELLAGGDFCE